VSLWDDPLPPRLRLRPIRPLRNPELIVFQLMQCFGRIGLGAKEAVPALTGLMAEIKSELRYDTALALWQIERTNDAAKTVLIEGLNIPSPDFPRRLVRHFRTMGVNEMPILNAALDHIDEEVRMAAYTVVSALAVDAEPALLALERVAEDTMNPLHRHAARALESIWSKAAQNSGALPPLREAAR
jgi:hypothetical protein